MARRLSNEQREKLKEEDGARVFTKKRVTVVPEAANEPEDVPRPLDTEQVTAAIEENGRQMVDAIQSIKMPESPKVVVESKPMIKKIHVENIERNGQNRIESADFTFTYQEMH